MNNKQPPRDLYLDLQKAAARIADLTGRDSHSTVLVLGSGFGHYAHSLEGATEVEFRDIPGFPLPRATGHAGRAYSVQTGNGPTLVLSGRAHAYEGHPMDDVTFAIRTAIVAGCRRVILTNAAGGIGDDIEPGQLVVLTDHINGAGISPLAGPNDDRLGPRFPDMTEVYSKVLREKAHQAAEAGGTTLLEGVYYWWHGPMFETPAEIQVAKILGATLIGMSTVPEATAARHMGAEIAAISLCTNKAAGISQTPLSSEDVMEVAAACEETVTSFLDNLLGVAS